MVLFDLPLGIVLTFLFLLGAVLGSFLNVCIYRIPHHEGVWRAWRGLTYPPSSCPYCRRQILACDNVPIFGWLWLRGRCRFCRHRIPFRYPAIELLNGLLFVVVYWFEIPAGYDVTLADSCLYSELLPRGVPNSWWLSPQALLHWRYAYHMVLLEALLVASFIDWDLWIIPDGVTVPAMVVGVLGAWAIGQLYLVPVWFQRQEMVNLLWGLVFSPEVDHTEWLRAQALAPVPAGAQPPTWVWRHPHAHGLAASIAGLLVGGGIVWGVRLIGGWTLKQEAMGFGDVMLMAAVGSFLGWQPTVMVFFVAPACALLVVGVSWLVAPQREIPYGPYLSLATLLVLLFWPALWPVAERFFELGPFVPVVAVFMAVSLAALLAAIQGVKWLLGIELYPPEWVEQWTSADQLTYQAAEKWDPQQGRWPVPDAWPGTAAATGVKGFGEWRRGGAPPSATGWTAQWHRRPVSR